MSPVLRWTEEGIPVADIVGIPDPNDTQLKVPWDLVIGEILQ